MGQLISVVLLSYFCELLFYFLTKCALIWFVGSAYFSCGIHCSENLNFFACEMWVFSTVQFRAKVLMWTAWKILIDVVLEVGLHACSFHWFIIGSSEQRCVVNSVHCTFKKKKGVHCNIHLLLIWSKVKWHRAKQAYSKRSRGYVKRGPSDKETLRFQEPTPPLQQ